MKASCYFKKGTCARFGEVVEVAKWLFHYGFIPFVVLLGYKRGANKDMPPFRPLTLLWYSP